MTIPLQRFQAIVGPSVRLRDALLAEVLAGWSGPVQRLIEPAELATLLLDLDTPSLFGDSALLVIRADQNFVVKHAEAVLAQLARPISAGALVLLRRMLRAGSAALPAASLLAVALAAGGRWLVALP